MPLILHDGLLDYYRFRREQVFFPSGSLPCYLDPNYWEQTFAGYVMKRDNALSVMLLGLAVGIHLPQFKKPFDGFPWFTFPIVKWISDLSPCIHRTYFLYGLSFTQAWYKKKNKHIRKVWQMEPSDIYVPEIWDLHNENGSQILGDLLNMTSTANFPKEISERFFSFSTLAHNHLNRHQPKNRREEDRVDLDEPIDIANYTMHQLEKLFPQIYHSMTDEIKQYHRAERKRRKELAEKAKKREKRKAAQNSKA